MAQGGSPLGPPLLKTYGSAGLHATSTYWVYLVAFIAVFFGGAWGVLRRTVGTSRDR